MSASTSSALWYLGRGTGVVSMVLLSLTVALGIAVRGGRPLPGLPRFVVAALHRNAALIAVGLLAVHVGTLLLDPYAQLRLVDVVLPFGGAYRPLWLGMGTLACDLMLVLVVTSLLRHRMGVLVWRAVHWTAYAAWPLAVLHSVGDGTDNRQVWLLVTMTICVAAVLAAVAWRLTAVGGVPAGTVPAGPPARPAPVPTLTGRR
jgi:sulfoxide reductase heme-binding subunit YedZ